MMRHLPNLVWLSSGSSHTGDDGAYSIAVNLPLLKELYIRKIGNKTEDSEITGQGMLHICRSNLRLRILAFGTARLKKQIMTSYAMKC